VEQISALQAELASFKQDYCSLFTNLTKDHSVTKEQRDTLKRENAELAADKERLDWLERLEAPSISQFGARNWQIYVNGRRFMGVFLRMAIDSAREALDAARKEPHAS
jgi:FtsZ-binding cell division protein ZapB